MYLRTKKCFNNHVFVNHSDIIVKNLKCLVLTEFTLCYRTYDYLEQGFPVISSPYFLNKHDRVYVTERERGFV